MSGNELSLGNMQDVLRDKVRNVLFSALPEEMIDQLVRKEFDDFFKPVEILGTYGNPGRTEPSRFETLIRAELHELLKVKIKQSIATAAYVTKYETEGEGIKQIHDLASDLAPVVAHAINREIAQSLLTSLQQTHRY